MMRGGSSGAQFATSSGGITGLSGPTGPFTKSSDYTVQASSFPSLTEAIQHVMQYRYLSGAKPIINFSAGSYTLEEAGYSFASFTMTGTTLDLTMTSIQSITGTGPWTVVINIAEAVSGVAIGDILGLGGLTGGTAPARLTGAFEVTAVDTANKRLTFVLNSALTTNAPAGAVAGAVKVYKSKVTLPALMDFCNISASGVAFLGSIGINSGTLSGTNNAFYITADSTISTGLTGTLYSTLSYFGGVELQCNYGGRMHIDASYIGNSAAPNSGIGLTASDGAMISFEAGVISGYTQNVMSKSSAHVSLEGTIVAYSTLGIKATNMATIDAASIVYTSNTTNMSPASYDTAGNRNAFITNTAPEA